ncbi:deoxyribodipyrimidine photo-lyase [Martelella sp. HB161492]|uniref:cryptochrome/photolyase family protein n=1 Tax=Martelella sp. HB161492 TaxID=2720726 RepID=UPI001591FE6C|nr:deoxyribodipyrimidine photo-lyase [Martelella sp. HB161492]
MPPRPAIIWFRKDLRLADNHALLAAAEGGRPVVAVYIRERDGNFPLGQAQAWWLEKSLQALGQALADRGTPLILKSGDALDVLRDLIATTGADAIFWNRRYDPPGIATDGRIKQALRDDGFTMKSFGGQILHEPTRLKTGVGGPYKVYTPFWKALQASLHVPPPADPPKLLNSPESSADSEALADWRLYDARPDWAAGFDDVWTPGEDGALKRLEGFLSERIKGYGAARDIPADAATSMLSPHLALGEISPAMIWHATADRQDAPAEDTRKFLQELVWRDFCYHLLFHAPDLATKNWNAKFDGLDWDDNETGFSAWTRGMTGYPIVDAGMRQLWREGYMHNRVRMIAASFLIKDLMIDWRRGETWFRDTLVDADPASNPASWQWVAGCGADAAPFFRIFNPILQGQKFDPEGDYVRHYVPELAALPAKYIHAPLEAPDPVLEKAGIVLGDSYPAPIVNHKQARDRALAAYKNLNG